MKAQELINILQEKINIYGNLEIYRPLDEGCNHCTISNVGRMKAKTNGTVIQMVNLCTGFSLRLIVNKEVE